MASNLGHARFTSSSVGVLPDVGSFHHPEARTSGKKKRPRSRRVGFSEWYRDATVPRPWSR